MNALHRDLISLVRIAEDSVHNLNDIWRLCYHVMPPVGWLNDPNGLCFFNNEYHIFFQYSPFNERGGLKFWGHYKSVDMVSWEYIPNAIIPDQPYDCHGVYSGSTLVEDGVMYIFYTGNVKVLGKYNYITDGRESNTIYAECSDGINVLNKEVVLSNEDYPSNLTCHVRDPKVWKENGVYYMLLGARDLADIGQVLLYKSCDKKSWSLLNIIKSCEKFGYMWECPDYIEIGGDKFLIVSPQGIDSDGKLYNNVYQSGYFRVDGSIYSEYELGEFIELDRGFDFYAPQTFVDGTGRRILIAWLGMADADDFYTNPTIDYGWQHCLTMPRVLGIRDGRLTQNPIEEMNLLRKHSIEFENVINCVPTCEINVYGDDENFSIIIDNGFKIEYNKGDFSISFSNDLGSGRTRRSVDLNRFENARIFIDRSTIEIFLNGGMEVFSTRFYPKNDNINIVFEGVFTGGEIWVIGSRAQN